MVQSSTIEHAQTTINTERIKVTPWPSEFNLKVFVIIISISIWLGLILSIFGIIYVVLIGLGLFFTHLLFIAMVRGNAVRISPQQFPQLYRRIEELSQRVGLKEVPESYIMESGGSLNALATKFLRSKMLILFSDLLEACNDDTAALDMIIGHEIGHIKEGHLDNMWFLLPGMFTPFIGSAYSRAREFTCDRYGFALTNDKNGALRGLAILAAGPTYGRKMNYETFVTQHEKLDNGWMTIGVWMMSHPPLCTRIAMLDQDLKTIASRYKNGPGRAIIILALMFAVVFGGSIAMIGFFATFVAKTSKNSSAYSNYSTTPDTSTYNYLPDTSTYYEGDGESEYTESEENGTFDGYETDSTDDEGN